MLGMATSLLRLSIKAASFAASQSRTCFMVTPPANKGHESRQNTNALRLVLPGHSNCIESVRRFFGSELILSVEVETYYSFVLAVSVDLQGRSMYPLTIVIPTYNGRTHLERC